MQALVQSSKQQSRRKSLLPMGAGFLLLGLFMSIECSGHVIPYDLKRLGNKGIALIYLESGFEHILPNGFDHILFIVSLYLLNPALKSVLTQATAFTVAHSITLGLALSGLITPPPDIIEPIIALSIVFVAVENMISSRLQPWRVLIVFLFGLIHGMGFSAALAEAGLPPTDFFTSLIMFNLGVELGQVAVILLLYLLIGRWFAKKSWYRTRIVIPMSIVIALIAFYWMIERVINS